MKKRLGTLVAAGALGLVLVAGASVAGVALTPGDAVAASKEATADGQSVVGQRLERIKEALSALVSDGTITQQQADKVAETLNRSEALAGHGGDHGMREGNLGAALDTAAQTLGMTQDELRTALRDGQTLADVAKSKGIEVQKVVDALVAAATKRVDQAVADGRVTKARADELKSGLQQRITAYVEQGKAAEGFGHGHHGRDA